MNAIKRIDELRYMNLKNSCQYWYYVILVNPHDVTAAAQALFDNLNIFHLDSGKECHYFIPGFENTGTGLLRGLFSFATGYGYIRIPQFGNLRFYEREFVESYRMLENCSKSGWRYSGGCELLLFNMNEQGTIQFEDFASYNLDDIVRNGRNISEFIRTTIYVGRDAIDQTNAKYLVDEKFYEMIMPDKETVLTASYKDAWKVLRNIGFDDDAYYFISYSTKDYAFVSAIRNELRRFGVQCWMAPWDIPNGFNYAWIIEHAIQHAGKFVLMLSENAVNSVWVGKELKRAISLFQKDNPEKLLVVWLERRFSLENTSFSLPLEDIQANIELRGTCENVRLIIENESM